MENFKPRPNDFDNNIVDVDIIEESLRQCVSEMPIKKRITINMVKECVNSNMREWASTGKRKRMCRSRGGN